MGEGQTGRFRAGLQLDQGVLQLLGPLPHGEEALPHQLLAGQPHPVQSMELLPLLLHEVPPQRFVRRRHCTRKRLRAPGGHVGYQRLVRSRAYQQMARRFRAGVDRIARRLEGKHQVAALLGSLINRVAYPLSDFILPPFRGSK